MSIFGKVAIMLKDPRIMFLIKVIPKLLKNRKRKKEITRKTLMEQIEELKDAINIKHFIKIEVIQRALEFWNDSYLILEKNGFNPIFVFVHIYHETGGFKHIIGKHNYWGIKTRKDTINKVKVLTHEYINGKKKYMHHYFRDWNTLEEALEFYMGLIKRLYPYSYENRNKTYFDYYDGLINGKYKYATDPIYAQKLKNLYKALTK